MEKLATNRLWRLSSTLISGDAAAAGVFVRCLALLPAMGQDIFESSIWKMRPQWVVLTEWSSEALEGRFFVPGSWIVLSWMLRCLWCQSIRASLSLRANSQSTAYILIR